jgi:hypothetical protein
MNPTPQPTHPTATAPDLAPGAVSYGLEAIALPDGMYVYAPSPTRPEPSDTTAGAWSSRWISGMLALLGLLVLLSVVGTVA